MKILFLSPQPFYQERGTPIAVKLALEALSRRLSGSNGILAEGTRPAAARIDVLAYSEGESVEIPGVTIHRIPTPKFLRGIRPGISVKKLLCDAIFAVCAFRMIIRNRREPYVIVHAVEESVFIAWLARKVFGLPYIYDMDSSLALQLTEKWWAFRPLLPIFELLEGMAVRGSLAVAPVCDALAAIASKHGSEHSVILRDVSLLGSGTDGSRPLRQELGISDEQPLVLYVGNLESYQGIDLLLESFARVASHSSRPHLAIVGGHPDSISEYTEKSVRLGCRDSVTFTGSRPVAELRDFLCSADILVSPRVKGNNTPMKIYSYLHSGRPVVATDLSTHRQVLDPEISILVPPTPSGFADGLLALLDDPELGRAVGAAARVRAESLYTIEAFESQLFALYNKVETSLGRTVPARSIAVGEKV